MKETAQKRKAERIAGAGSQARGKAGHEGESPRNKREGRISVREILKAVAEGMRGNLDESASSHPTDLALTLADFDPDDLEEALAMAGEFRGKREEYEAVCGLLFAVLSDVDLERAKNLLLSDQFLLDGKVPSWALQAVMGNMSRKDPAGALDWGLGLMKDGKTFLPAGKEPSLVYWQWMRENPVAALKDAEQRANEYPTLARRAVGWASIGARAYLRDLLTGANADRLKEREQVVNFFRRTLAEAPDEMKTMLARIEAGPELREELTSP